MTHDAALADEAPLTFQSLPFWALFVVVFVVVTIVGSVLIAATSLLPRREAPSAAVTRRGRMRPDAAKHLLVLPPARL
jgi:hypothetical protein